LQKEKIPRKYKLIPEKFMTFALYHKYTSVETLNRYIPISEDAMLSE
jgi:hypothetical protein